MRRADRLICPHCALTVRYAPIDVRQIARCRRCDAVLWRGQKLGVQGLLALAVASAVVFVVAQATAIVSVAFGGSPRLVDLPSSVALTWLHGESVVAVLAFATALAVPAAVIGLRLYVLGSLFLGKVPVAFTVCMRALHSLSHWNMVEVLTIGALVSIVRMSGLATVVVQPALFAFATLALLLAAQEATGHLPLWQWADRLRRAGSIARADETLVQDRHAAESARSRKAPMTAVPLSAAASETAASASASASSSAASAATVGDDGWIGCPDCHLASRIDEAQDAARRPGLWRLHPSAALRCPRCDHVLHRDQPLSVQRTWALIAASTACYIPANALPIMQTTNALRTESHTILGGIAELWTGGTQLLAVIVFVASILVPILKIGALSLLAWSVNRVPRWRRLERARIYRIVEAVGHWSMLDVYVVVLLTAMVRFGELAAVRPGPGLLPFAAVVVLTVLAARSFDARLIWQDGAPRTAPIEAGRLPLHA